MFVIKSYILKSFVSENKNIEHLAPTTIKNGYAMLKSL